MCVLIDAVAPLQLHKGSKEGRPTIPVVPQMVFSYHHSKQPRRVSTYSDQQQETHYAPRRVTNNYADDEVKLPS